MTAKPKPDPSKPKVVLANPRTMTAEDFGRMYRALTGKDATPEEIEELRPMIAELQAQMAADADLDEDEDQEDDEPA